MASKSTHEEEDVIFKVKYLTNFRFETVLHYSRQCDNVGLLCFITADSVTMLVYCVSLQQTVWQCWSIVLHYSRQCDNVGLLCFITADNVTMLVYCVSLQQTVWQCWSIVLHYSRQCDNVGLLCFITADNVTMLVYCVSLQQAVWQCWSIVLHLHYSRQCDNVGLLCFITADNVTMLVYCASLQQTVWQCWSIVSHYSRQGDNVGLLCFITADSVTMLVYCASLQQTMWQCWSIVLHYSRQCGNVRVLCLITADNVTIESFSKSRYRPNSRYFHRNFKNSVKSIAFLCYPGPNSVGRNAIFWIHAIVLPLDSDAFFLPVYRPPPPPPAPHDWAAFGLWRFRKKETSSFCSWIWWFFPTFSVSADIDVHSCCVVKRPKAHSHLKASKILPSHIRREVNRSNHDCPSFGSGKCLLKRRTRGPPWLSKPRSTHTGQLVGPGEASDGDPMGERWAGWVQSSNPACQLWKLYGEFAKAVFSIHAIFDSRYWNSVTRYFAKGLYWRIVQT